MDDLAISADGKQQALFDAIARDDVPAIGAILDSLADSYREDVLEDVVVHGRTALYAAVEHDNAQVVQLLLENGADPDVAVMGITALHVAAAAGRKDMLMLLLPLCRPIGCHPEDSAKADWTDMIRKGEVPPEPQFREIDWDLIVAAAMGDVDKVKGCYGLGVPEGKLSQGDFLHFVFLHAVQLAAAAGHEAVLDVLDEWSYPFFNRLHHCWEYESMMMAALPFKAVLVQSWDVLRWFSGRLGSLYTVQSLLCDRVWRHGLCKACTQNDVQAVMLLLEQSKFFIRALQRHFADDQAGQQSAESASEVSEAQSAPPSPCSEAHSDPDSESNSESSSKLGTDEMELVISRYKWLWPFGYVTAGGQSLPVVKVLLEAVPQAAIRNQGNEIVELAAERLDCRAVRLMLQHGCPVQDPYTGLSVLPAAVRSGDVGKVQAILEAGAGLDGALHTLMTVPRLNNLIPILELLLVAGASPCVTSGGWLERHAPLVVGAACLPIRLFDQAVDTTLRLSKVPIPASVLFQAARAVADKAFYGQLMCEPDHADTHTQLWWINLKPLSAPDDGPIDSVLLHSVVQKLLTAAMRSDQQAAEAKLWATLDALHSKTAVMLLNAAYTCGLSTPGVQQLDKSMQQLVVGIAKDMQEPQKQVELLDSKLQQLEARAAELDAREQQLAGREQLAGQAAHALTSAQQVLGGRVRGSENAQASKRKR